VSRSSRTHSYCKGCPYRLTEIMIDLTLEVHLFVDVLYVNSQSVGPTSDNGGRIWCFEERNEENWYSPWRKTIESWKQLILQSDHYDLNVKYLSYEKYKLTYLLLHFNQLYKIGRAIAQAVSRRLPTAAAWVQTWVLSCGILWWTKVALGQVFSENFDFPYQFTNHLLLQNHLHYHPRLAQ
jgi:hypothetical protein